MNDFRNEHSLAGPLVPALRSLTEWLESRRVPYVLIGGIAASILGRPRATHDIDVLVNLDDDALKSFVDSGVSYGFSPRISDYMAFAAESRVLLMRHAQTSVDVDVVLAGLAFEKDVIAAGRLVPFGRAEVYLPRREDLIVMKCVAARPRDVADAEGLISAADKIDWDYVMNWARQFAAALDSSEITATLERLRRQIEHA